MLKKNITVIIVGISLLLIVGFVVPSVSSFLAVVPAVNLTPGDEVTVNCSTSLNQTVHSPQSRTLKCKAITATRVPTRTTTATSNPSNTPSNVPATASKTFTPIPSLPVTPSKTATSTTAPPTQAGGIQPFASAPLCPTHENTVYHGLWDSVRGCHYDHTHNDDPALGNSVFGAVQSISYPWLTSNENDEHGHPGYKYYVNINPQPACANESWEYLGSVNCVSDFRIQYHDVGTNSHMVKRFHSYYMEVQIKKGNTVGIIRTGGWADGGCLHGAYKEFFIPLPGIDPVQSNGNTQCGPGGQGLDPDPYRAFSNTWQEVQNGATGDNVGIWTTSNNKYGYNKLAGFFFRTLDPFGAIDAANPNADHFICPDFKCKFNNSEHHVFTVFMTIPQSMDNSAFDTNPVVGIITGQGYTNVQGALNAGCLAPSSNCVPLQLVNVPVGTAIWGRNLSGLRPPGDPVHDSDIYFNGIPSGWILPSPQH